MRQRKPNKRQRRAPAIDRERTLIRLKLERFASQLRGHIHAELTLERSGRRFPRSIDHDLAEFIAHAFRSYLEGDAASIDRALGLVRDGPRSAAGKYFRIAREEIAPRLLAGKTFKKIWNDLDQEYSEDLLRQIWAGERQYVLDEYRRKLDTF